LVAIIFIYARRISLKYKKDRQLKFLAEQNKVVIVIEGGEGNQEIKNNDGLPSIDRIIMIVKKILISMVYACFF
jgi:hypothetical protein